MLESIKCYRKLKIILFSNKPLFLFCKKFAIAAAILLNCEFINSMWALFFPRNRFFSNFKTVWFFRVWIGIQTHVIFILNIQINHVTYYFLHVKESLDHTTLCFNELQALKKKNEKIFTFKKWWVNFLSDYYQLNW